MKPKMCDTDGRRGEEERRGVLPTTGPCSLNNTRWTMESQQREECALGRCGRSYLDSP